MIEQAHINWFRNLFRLLNEGGVWGVPRSGLLFRKRGDAMVLIACMPHVAEMPVTAEQLKEQQEREYRDTKAHFEAAGVKVLREDGGPP